MSTMYDPVQVDPGDSIFTGESEMAILMRNYRWEEHPLGPPQTWPASLRAVIRMMLHSGFPMFIWWSEDFYMFHNDPYLQALGDKHPEALGASAREMWSEVWHNLGRTAEGILHGDEHFYAENLLVPLKRKGFLEETYWTFSYSPLADDNNQVGGIFCACSEVTTKVLSERRLRVLKSLAESAIQTTTVAQACQQITALLLEDQADLPFGLIYLVDADAKIARLAGQTEQLPTKMAPAVIDLSANSNEVWPLSTVYSSRKTHPLFPLPDNWLSEGAWERPPRQAVILPLFKSDQKQIRGFFVVGVNSMLEYNADYQNFHELIAGQIASILSKIQALEEERKRLQVLAELDQAKTVFFNNISHEFRTPLTLMLGPLEELRNASLPAAVTEQLHLIYRNGLRLLRLVNNLLEFSQIEAGRLEAKFQPLALDKLTIELSSVFRSAIEKAGLQLQLRCRPLPEPVYVDAQLWERIVFNLLSNALKFTFEGAITIQLRADGKYAELQVKDTGIGIPEEELPHLFSRFHRIKGVRSRTHEGSGIGLAMVYDLVKLHGGTIAVDSTLEKGTTFTVRLPFGKKHLPADHLIDADPAAYQVAVQHPLEDLLHWFSERPSDTITLTESLEQESEQQQLTAGERPRLLIVDDNADMRSYICNTLSPYYDLQTAEDGAQAWKKILQNPPDLIVSDVMMPVMNGLELLKKIRSDAQLRPLPVILLSARAGEEEHLKGISAGAHDYMTKPFSVRELKARIDNNLEIARLRDRVTAAEKEAREISEHQQQSLLSLFEQAPVAISIFHGPDYIITLANSAMESLWSRPREEVMGLPVSDAFPEAREQGFVDLIKQVYQTGEAFIGTEVPAMTIRDGIEHHGYYNFVYQPMRNADGEVTDIITVAVDVTEQVIARSKLENKNHELTLINADLDNFVYTASHDLKSPITNIQGLIDILRDELAETRLSNSVDSIITTMEQSVGRFMSTISNLSEITKLQKEGNQPVEPVDINEVIQDVLLDLSAQIKQSNAQIELELENCPPICFAVKHMRSIVYNLISNSLKYRATDRPCRIHISCADQEGYRVLTITDNGLGIDLRKEDKLFAMFQRLHDHVEGAGIGLYIVKKIVESAGGKIEVMSEVNKGATFRVFFKK